MESNCARMLITSPLVTRITVHWDMKCRGRFAWKCTQMIVENTSGVRFSDIISAAKKCAGTGGRRIAVERSYIAVDNITIPTEIDWVGISALRALVEKDEEKAKAEGLKTAMEKGLGWMADSSSL
ncbi:hypothetical protein LTR08_003676 [Meristemomyces frigidus]|nr:hypothetical protein LTR08_003676 [Meristemomyces frigidus]